MVLLSTWDSLITGERIIDHRVNIHSSSDAWQESEKIIKVSDLRFKDVKDNSLKKEQIKLTDALYKYS